MIENYEQQVYASTLGKVAGVFFGKPFEGWKKEEIQAKLGTIDRYVHGKFGRDIVEADDDISGTFTFIRALEDSGRYASVRPRDFGDAWLNYLIEGVTVLWWGGMGKSTEHTAYLRLKSGVKPPRSGSIALNGKTVAEQIGAQIFIDSCGMVAPGNPKLAAKLAKKAGSVSHDGESVYAAQVVAAMVAAAFVEKDMEKLLDIGVGVIPKDCIIARIHADVRRWAQRDGDWEKTFEKIKKKYGYKKYAGGCHVVPNHALMVMAWAYAPDDFFEAMKIVNTAGWDTDCNSGNVGSVMGLVVGLEGINKHFDFYSPFSGRMLLPTAEGSRMVSDVLREALAVAGMGRKVMGWPELPKPKRGAWIHFEMPGALQAWMPSKTDKAGIRLSNVSGHSRLGKRSMRVEFSGLKKNRAGEITVPLYHVPKHVGYNVVGCPKIAPGMSVEITGKVGKISGEVDAKLFADLYVPEDFKDKKDSGRLYSKPVVLVQGKSFRLKLVLPDSGGLPAKELGIELRGKNGAGGEIFVDAVRLAGSPKFRVPNWLPRLPNGSPAGWISTLDRLDLARTTDGKEHAAAIRNKGRGILVTGTDAWRDYSIEAVVTLHMADRGGLIARYRGLERYIAFIINRTGKLQLIMRRVGKESVLAEMKHDYSFDEPRRLKLKCLDETITACLDEKKIFEAKDEVLGRGGAGFLVNTGSCYFRNARVF